MRPVNLLPDELRPRQRTQEGRGPAHILIGVLGVLLVMAVAYAMSLNQANSRKTDIASAKAEIEMAKVEVAASTSFGDFHDVKETRVASVKQLAAGRFDWERLMRELALVLPERTWLLDVTASTSAENAPAGGAGTPPPSTAGSSASAETAEAGAGGSSPTLTLKGCALRQKDVAVLLVRLRKLHRAEDVDLRESAAETAGTTGAQASGADSAGGSESCGNKRFKFETAVTFSPTAQGEKPAGGKVPATLGGGS
jgi:Tfp pilus assembly protein PilN